MASCHSSHADTAEAPPPSASRPPAMPKLHVQGSLSRKSITIHFSPLGEEEKEEELYGAVVSSPLPPAGPIKDPPGIVTAPEASEDLILDGAGLDSEAQAAVLPMLSSTGPQSSITSTLPSELKRSSPSPATTSKSTSSKSSDKPFFSLVKSLSSDIIEPSENVSIYPAAPTSVRHCHPMKTLVKSLSSDTSQESPPSSSSSPYRLSDSRLNLHLFKQFTQSRAPVGVVAGADSKTAPSSTLTSPDSRNFFKASVEASIEDTKRRFSEAIYEPLQLFNKIMEDKTGGIGSSAFRSKALSSSASELTCLASLNNGQPESNNNYSIKEEETGDEWESEGTGNGASSPNPTSDTRSPKMSSTSLSLDNCSMSALAKLEDEDFCILSSEDFEDIEGDYGDTTDDTCSQVRLPPSGSPELCSDDKSEGEDLPPSIPHYTLIIITALVYGYFVLPLPTYVGGMLLGVGLGFMLAIAVVWLAGPKPSGNRTRHPRHQGKLRNMAQLGIKEPSIFKGWMNEIVNYDPETYHATLTHSVYVRLEGSILRLSTPNHNIARRATHNEPKPDVTYISQKIYDLTDSKIYLVPQSLARKRVWNKKYPIRIELAKQDDFMSKAEGDHSETTHERTTATGEATVGTEEAKRSVGPELTLYLFGRTGREKEEWHRRILLASKPPKTGMKRVTGLQGSKAGEWMDPALSSHSRSSSRSSLDEVLASQPRTRDSTAGIAAKSLLDYSVYMATLVPPETGTATATPIAATSPVVQSPQSSPGSGKKLQSSSSFDPVVLLGEEEPVAWVNSVIGRVAWDFLGEPYWADVVSKKIQMKLSKIRLPYFMNELTLTELDMGVATPRILGASKPSVDHQGLWFDLEISYSGSFLMTLETKMNLIRLGKDGDCMRFRDISKDGYRPRTYCLADSDEESSSAGSSDEEDTSEVTNDVPGAEGHMGGRQPSKIMRFVDKIAKSKYFQKATETEFIKKKMEEVSNTPLLLTVEVQELRGTLAVNIPPPPTDRIWYGFRGPPHLELKARPKLGEREVTLAHVTDWIEKKLDQEFQKIFVMPNMDDLWLTIMHSAMDPRSFGTPSTSTADTTQRETEPSETEGGATNGI
uniref:Testis expressed 2 n=1 Tax=Oncorhynchus kisutch TaxID=8019 RepID=A0A8C7H0V9_ONCKI